MNIDRFKLLAALLALSISTVGAQAQSADAPAPATAAAAPDAPPKIFTMDELKAAFANKQYPVILQQISRIQSSPKVLADYDRYDLTVLRAETELRSHLAYNAGITFGSAAKLAPDAHAAATNTALALLAKRSENLIYTPRHQGDATDGAKQTFDVTNMDQRKDALTALFNDEKLDAVPKITAAENGTSLLPIIAVGAPLTALDPLEVAATNADTYVSAERKTLATHAVDLINKALDGMDDRIAAIKRNANNRVERDTPTYANGRQTGVQRNYYLRGLSTADVQNLDDMKTTASEIPPASQDLATGLHQEADMFAKVVTLARKISTDANDVLNANYGRVQ